MTNIDAEKQQLLDTVQAYAELAREKGFVAAAREFMAEDAVMIAENQAPIKGRETICAHLATLPDLTITWEPFYVDMAASCDLAYTLGSWRIHVTDDDGQPKTHPGNYVTIWRKQSDDQWRCVFDAGHPGPPPALSRTVRPIN